MTIVMLMTMMTMLMSMTMMRCSTFQQLQLASYRRARSRGLGRNKLGTLVVVVISIIIIIITLILIGLGLGLFQVMKIKEQHPISPYGVDIRISFRWKNCDKHVSSNLPFRCLDIKLLIKIFKYLMEMLPTGECQMR